MPRRQLTGEAAVLAQCLQLLRLCGCEVWRQNQGALKAKDRYGRERFVRFSGAKGVSDILGLIPPTGRFLAVEVKHGRNQPTDDQLAFLGRVKAAGGLALCVWSVEELRLRLQEEGLTL